MSKKLTKCRTCEKDISPNAKRCPHCGEQSPHSLSSYLKKFLIFMTFIILVALFAPLLIKSFLTQAIVVPLKERHTINNEKKETDKTQTNIIKAIKITPPKLTKEQLCNKEWWAYFRKSSKIISDIQKENTKIKRKLGKRNIDYGTVLKQKIKPVKLNLSKLKKESCSQNYFNQLKQKEKSIKEVTQENVILKELMRVNYIK